MWSYTNASDKEASIPVALENVGQRAVTLVYTNPNAPGVQMPALTLTISALAVLIFSAFILVDLQRVVNGGETNYVTATVGLYVSVFNLFVSLLQLMGIGGGDE